jgi:lipoate-protein ligase A
MHDRELTYLLCLPASHPLARESKRLYEIIHRALIGSLAAWRLRLELFGDRRADAPEHGSAGEPFLCFARRTEVDVVSQSTDGGRGTIKIVGSAQRRRRGAVLQHGGVLLAASSMAPELRGIEQLAGLSLAREELIEPWAAAIAKALQLQLRRQALDAQLAETAQRLQREKYGARSWTERR